MTVKRTLPQCWGHRGASARFPENTLASFEAAIRDGADGIESDVHVSKDDVIVMFHDPTLQRTTDFKGVIKELNWHGPDGMSNARTLKEPRQAIPTFIETVELLMKPENQHVQFNIDVKPSNDPIRLFNLIHSAISKHPNWEKALAPRLLLGIWHPKFLEPAKKLLPYCRRSSIGFSIRMTKKHLFDDVDSVSMWFNALASRKGQKFLQEAKAAGKTILVFTVNDPDHLLECVHWGVDIIITDTTNRWLDLRKLLEEDYEKTISKQSRLFLYTSPMLYWPWLLFVEMVAYWILTSRGGPLVKTPFEVGTPGRVQLQAEQVAGAVIEEAETS